MKSLKEVWVRERTIRMLVESCILKQVSSNVEDDVSDRVWKDICQVTIYSVCQVLRQNIEDHEEFNDDQS